MKEKRRDIIGFSLLKNQWVQMIAYVALIAFMLIVKPPFWISLVVIDVYIILKAVYEKKFSIKGTGTSLAYADGMLLLIYAMYWMIGGIWTVVIVHVLVGGLIIYAQRKFIMKAWADLKYCLDKGIKEPRRRRKEWLESQKLIKK